MKEANADLEVTDLADVATRDLMLLLSICPGEFYLHMHAHPKDFESWLRYIDTIMFVGSEPGQRTPLENYRRALLLSVRASMNDGQYAQEKLKILTHIDAKQVRITD